jgi:carbonic anhydrase
MGIRDTNGHQAGATAACRGAVWLASSLLCWLVVVGWPTPGEMSAAADEESATAPSSVSPAEALQRLKDGNQRFVAGKPLHQRQNAARRAELVSAQHPFAAILGCSDSRVPLEIVFDQELGDLFAVRVAGNVAGGDERGSLQYAAAHLGIPLVVVLGHERCGAVSAGARFAWSARCTSSTAGACAS